MNFLSTVDSTFLNTAQPYSEMPHTGIGLGEEDGYPALWFSPFRGRKSLVSGPANNSDGEPWPLQIGTPMMEGAGRPFRARR